MAYIEGYFNKKYILNYCYRSWTVLGDEEYDTIEEAQAMVNEAFDEDEDLVAVEIYELNLVNNMKKVNRKKD